jgi:transcriptional regulator with XRE-family HTH domain
VLDLSPEFDCSDVDQMSTRLSDAFAKIRQVRGHAIAEAATHLDLTPRELRGIESGSLHPDPELITRMADFYGIDAERLGTEVMIQRSDPGIDPETCVIWFGWLPIEYGSNLASNEEILEAVADGIRLLRSVGPTASVQMRSSELDIVLTLLDLSDEDLIPKAVRAFRLPWKRTEQLIDESRSRVRTKSLVQWDHSVVALQTT